MHNKKFNCIYDLKQAYSKEYGVDISTTWEGSILKFTFTKDNYELIKYMNTNIGTDIGHIKFLFDSMIHELKNNGVI